MVWEASNQNGGFSNERPWLPVSSEHLHMAAAIQEDDPGALIHHYRKAIAFRHSHEALSIGAHSAVKSKGDVVYFTRTYEGQEIFCAFNVSDTPSDFDLPAGDWTPI